MGGGRGGTHEWCVLDNVSAASSKCEGKANNLAKNNYNNKDDNNNKNTENLTNFEEYLASNQRQTRELKTRPVSPQQQDNAN